MYAGVLATNIGFVDIESQNQGRQWGNIQNNWNKSGLLLVCWPRGRPEWLRYSLQSSPSYNCHHL